MIEDCYTQQRRLRLGGHRQECLCHIGPRLAMASTPKSTQRFKQTARRSKSHPSSTPCRRAFDPRATSRPRNGRVSVFVLRIPSWGFFASLRMTSGVLAWVTPLRFTSPARRGGRTYGRASTGRTESPTYVGIRSLAFFIAHRRNELPPSPHSPKNRPTLPPIPAALRRGQLWGQV